MVGIEETQVDVFFEGFTCKSVAEEGRNWLAFISVIHFLSFFSCI